ncbi:general transcription factor II-I repeat domain-containing protein 2B-like [Macrobrachium nipponense]|uniref:general transcription factor II-I repeat domain-containing protein 2B-like n=1 Tax=Macrobrachium nipponense TaxID=159736 RepID=UPI0030C7C9A3
MATAKKIKLDVRSFQSSWTNDFGFIQQNDRAVCALCCENVVCRTSSVKRHFETKHEKTFKDSADKAEAIKKAVSRYGKQSNVFKNLSASKSNETEASYKLALCIAKHGKPFTDGDFIKAAFLECSEVLFDGITNKHVIISRIKDMPVSARTVERRISEMADNVTQQQTVALTITPVFSVALDESVDINDIPRLAVFARYSDTEVHEELCCLKPMYGTTKGEDILKAFTDHFENRGVDIGERFLQLQRMVLSCGKVLERFVGCFDEIKVFLSEKEDYPELEDGDWIVKLMFLSDITKHLNEFNLLLQGAGKTVLDLYDNWKAFVAKLAIYSTDVETGSFRYFKNLKNLSSMHPVNTSDLQLYMQELKSEFSIRFQDFQHMGPVFSFLIRPDTFKYSDLDTTLFEWMETEELEMQLIDFQASTLWSAKFKDLREILESSKNDHATSILRSWASLPDKFNCMKKVAFALLSAYGSTYQCEQIFSQMKHILSPHRSRLTTDHSEGCVKLKVSKYSPEISTLVKGKQEGQGSH